MSAAQLSAVVYATGAVIGVIAFGSAGFILTAFVLIYLKERRKRCSK
jgi:hypothetical protein